MTDWQTTERDKWLQFCAALTEAQKQAAFLALVEHYADRVDVPVWPEAADATA
jgi:hypothetical protein